jgi:GNAT superfamily N-acetyltransferase
MRRQPELPGLASGKRTSNRPESIGRTDGRSQYRRRPRNARSRATSTVRASGSTTPPGDRSGTIEPRSVSTRASAGSVRSARRWTLAGVRPCDRGGPAEASTQPEPSSSRPSRRTGGCGSAAVPGARRGRPTARAGRLSVRGSGRLGTSRTARRCAGLEWRASPHGADGGGPADDPRGWGISCFVTKAGCRRQGIATALLAVAVDWGRKNGARALDVCPADASADRPPISHYHGLASTFRRAGLRESRTTSPRSAVDAPRVQRLGQGS